MATGAALLGSALLGAVSYQNTELINDNGAPMAKVVVGSNAHISDGVAAANIAAVLGNMAFKSVEVTATPTGINGLSCDVSGDSAGTCSVLSKSVDLEVVTPAGVIPAGAYGFSTLINDYIDANLENRNAISSSDKEDSSFGTNASIKKIKANDFTVLADYSVKDPQSSISVVEKQYLYVGSGTENGDEGDATRVFYNADKSDYEVENLKMAYEIEFIDYGIPVCSDSKSGWWAYCKEDADNIDTDKQLENHRVKVKFLGEEWIISEMKSFVQGGKAVNTEYTGGSIKLAKEDAYSPKLQIGEDLPLGDGNKLVLGDLKPASGGQENDIAIFSVLNAAGEEIASKTVAAGATTEITAGSSTYRVRVYQVAPGYTLTEKWAEVAVFSNELLLENGKDLENNKDWRVSLVWKDKDGDNATYEVDHLHKIQLNLKNDVDVDNFRTGDSLTLVQDPAKFRLTFTGLDLVDSDYERVTLGFESKKSYYSSKPGISEDAGDATRLDSGYLVKMSADSDLFTINALNGSTKYSVDTLWLSYSTAGDLPVVLFEESGYLYPINNFVNTTDAINFTIDYKVDKTKQMTIVVPNYTIALADTEDIEMMFVFEEEIGNDKTGVVTARIVGDETKEDRYVFDSKGWADTDDYDTVLYNSDSENEEYLSPTATYELPFITERGTKVDGRKTSMTIDFAKKIGKLSFVLQTMGATESEAGAMLYPNLKEGDSIDVLGAKVKVKAIDVNVGPCTSTTGAGSVTGIEGIACTINANVANLGERQNIPTDLVIMDKAATNVETVIAVGGPMVNDVTAALFPAENPLQGAGDVYIAEVAAGKIVVAGYTADDTMNAAMNFIATLRGQ